MNNLTPQSTHRTLILRCWTEQDEVRTRRFWRFHLQWLDTEERQGFADVEALLAVLADTFGSEPDLNYPDANKA